MRITMLLGVAALCASSAAGRAQKPASVGTIVVAHGGDSTWNSLVLETAKAAKTGGPVEVSFLMGPAAKTHRFQDAVLRLERQGVSSIAVVPLLVSSYSGHYDQIRYLAGDSVKLDEQMMHHLHMAGLAPPVTRVPMRVTRAMDDAPHVARVLLDRARALARDPASRAVFIVGHGPNTAEDHAAWMTNMRAVADSVRVWGGYRDVRTEVVRDDAAPPVRAEAVRRVRELIELQHLATRQPVLVVPLLVSKGTINRDKLPNDLKGLNIVYSGDALLPHPEIARLIEERVRQTFGAASN